MNTTHIVHPGEVLTIVADAVASGNLVRLSDAGVEPIATTPVSASSTLLIGPFSAVRRYRIEDVTGSLQSSVAVSDLPLAAVADAAAATAVAFPAGGTGTAAGGWDTASNRNLAITRFTALLADVADLRAQLNAALAKLRTAGILQ